MGKRFQSHVIDSCKSCNVHIMRLKDSIGSWGGNRKVSFTLDNPSDFIVYHDGKLIYLEAKSFKKKSMPFANITKGQIEGMKKIIEEDNEGVKTCFIFYARDIEKRYLVKGSDVIDFVDNADRKSIPIKFMKEKGIELKLLKNKRVLFDIRKGLDSLF